MKNTRVVDSTALLIRALTRGFASWAGYSAVFLSAGSAATRLLPGQPRFFRACLEAQLAALSPTRREATAGSRTSGLREAWFTPARPTRAAVDRTLLRLSKGAAGRLRDERVRRLQAVIVNRILESDCGIKPDRAVREELAYLDSVAWVRDSVLVAAGLPLARVHVKHQGRGQHPHAARCRVVLPVLLNTLRMHRGWAGVAAQTSTAKVSHPAPAKLFPEDLARRELEVLERCREVELGERYRVVRLRQPEAELETFLSAMSLMSRTKRMKTGTARRLLRRITDYHTRRTGWTHGPEAPQAQATQTARSIATLQRT